MHNSARSSRGQLCVVVRWQIYEVAAGPMHQGGGQVAVAEADPRGSSGGFKLVRTG
jgi:hypothetical protein